MFDAARARLTYANVMASVAVFLALGGGAIAATGGFADAGGRIHGCVSKKGALTIVKPGRHCRKGTTAIAWNQQGPAGQAGQRGLTGQQGPKGDPGPATGAAGGDLAGNYPNPTIRPTLQDAAADTPSLRSLGSGALQAMPGNATPNPGGAAGGDLTGSFPAPTIGQGKVTPDKLGGTLAGRLKGTVDQSIPDGHSTMTDVFFSGVDFDRGGVASAGANHLTAPRAGIYVITAYVKWDGPSGAGTRKLGISHNNSSVDGRAIEEVPAASSGHNTSETVTTILSLASNDTVSAKVSQDSGAALNLKEARLSMAFLGN